MPLISVIVPSFNRAHTLPQAIQSVLVQTFEDWELIIVDDGSSDNTEKVLDPYLKDRRFSYYYQENKGVSAARNHGSSVAQGDYFMFLDSDDELEKDALSNFYNAINQSHFTDVFIAGLSLMKRNQVIDYHTKENQYNPTLPGTYIIKKEAFDQLGGFDENLSYSENTELFFRIDQIKVSKKLLSFISLKYHESAYGGSKNHLNKANSLAHILKKHDQYLSKHVKRLFNQIIGVSYLRLGNYIAARTYLRKAYSFSYLELKTLGRCVLAYFPFLARKIYPVIHEK